MDYDKLRGMETDEEKFDFKCPYCGVDGLRKGNFDIKPVGVPYKPDAIDNSDIQNKKARKYLDSLPVKRDAIIKAHNSQDEKTELLIYCNVCKTFVIPKYKIHIRDLRKWLRKNTREHLVL